MGTPKRREAAKVLALTASRGVSSKWLVNHRMHPREIGLHPFNEKQANFCPLESDTYKMLSVQLPCFHIHTEKHPGWGSNQPQPS
jgi:hypothetical protein